MSDEYTLAETQQALMKLSVASAELAERIDLRFKMLKTVELKTEAALMALSDRIKTCCRIALRPSSVQSACSRAVGRSPPAAKASNIATADLSPRQMSIC